MIRAEKVPFPELHVRPKWVKICLSKDVQQADRQCREEVWDKDIVADRDCLYKEPGYNFD